MVSTPSGIASRLTLRIGRKRTVLASVRDISEAKSLDASQNDLRNAIYQANETKVELNVSVEGNRDAVALAVSTIRDDLPDGASIEIADE